MDFLANALHTFQVATKDTDKVFVSVYPVPGGRETAICRLSGTPDEVWHEVDHAIRAAQNRFSKFNIRLSLNTLNNPAPIVIPVDTPAAALSYSAQQQPAGIAGFTQTAESIGAIEKRLEAKYEEKLKQELAMKELKDQVAGLSEELRMKRRKGDWMERIGEFADQTGLDLSNPQSINAIAGIVLGGLDKILAAVFPGVVQNAALQPAPAVSGIPAAKPAPAKTRISELPPVVAVAPPAPNLEPPNDDDDDDFQKQCDLACDAVEMLLDAGIEAPGEKIKVLADFYIQNPATVEGILASLTGGQKPASA